MTTVGITGGIGSGKTEVCKVWEALGAYVLNADDLAKNIMVEDDRVRKEITETFGRASYRDDGSLNRAHLADEAFRKGRVDELNAIVHPRIPEASRTIMEQAENNGYELFVYEAALLFENLQPGFLDYIVLVLSDRDRRVERVQQRDEVDRKEVLDRIDKQQDFENLAHRADFVIRNNGTLEELRTRAETLYKELTLQHRP